MNGRGRQRNVWKLAMALIQIWYDLDQQRDVFARSDFRLGGEKQDTASKQIRKKCLETRNGADSDLV